MTKSGIYDLKIEPWLPWRRRDGATEWGTIADLTRDLEVNPVVAVASGRPDFDGAVQEFLIGILTTAFHPEGSSDWRTLYESPPSPERIQLALEPLPPAFQLDSEGPRFFQDLSVSDFVDADVIPIGQLLIDAPGDQGLKLNTDLFVKRGRAERMSRPAAAMALLTMQTYAPSGGQGHRTSLRGGGPLTTLVDPRVDAEGASRAHQQPLWRKLWANVELMSSVRARTPGAIPAEPIASSTFPWMAATRTSNPKRGGAGTTLNDAHPLQAYFGLPRRIRLEFGEPGTCDVTGLWDERTVTGFRMLNYGVEYVGWQHPLTPQYFSKPSAEWLPVHGQPGGVGWRDWMSLTLSAEADATRRPAATTARVLRDARELGVRYPRLHAFGYDMANMKARGWIEANLPAFAADAERQRALLSTATALSEATSIAGTGLLSAVKTSLFQSAENANGDLDRVKRELWEATTTPFFGVMQAVAQAATDDQAWDVAAEQKPRFAGTIRDQALCVFDRWCPSSGTRPDALRRRVAARHDLTMTLLGYSKLGEKLFQSLGISPPGGGAAARKASRTKQEATK